ncbi:hypothetical protein WJ968_04615 [Achromobacter xylosoxidans]
MSAATTFSASTLGLIVYTLCMPISGALSDRIGSPPGAGRVVAGLRGAARADDALRDGRRRVAALGDLCRHGPDRPGQRRGRDGFAEQFPTRVRAIGWGAPYNISIAVFGGTAPYLGSWFASKGWPDLFNGYIAVLCALSGLAAFGLRDLRGKPLD